MQALEWGIAPDTGRTATLGRPLRRSQSTMRSWKKSRSWMTEPSSSSRTTDAPSLRPLHADLKASGLFSVKYTLYYHPTTRIGFNAS